MVRGLKVTVDLNLAAVSCPGVVLTTKGSLFLELHIFNRILRSDFHAPIFPLLLHKKLSCSYVFPLVTDPGKLAENLNREVVNIRLLQESGLGDQLLAQYRANARDFLFPTPQLTDTYPGVEREIILSRTSVYSGILEPKFEFGSKTTIKEVNARPKYGKGDASRNVSQNVSRRAQSPSAHRSRGHFEMSAVDERLTRKTAENLSRAKLTLERETARRSRSARRRSDLEPKYMASTISFRAKSPQRQMRSKAKTKKALPFLAGTADSNLARYQPENTETTTNIVPHEEPSYIDDEANTYEKIRQRITRLLKSPRAQEVNRNGELDAALLRLDRKIANERSPRVRLSEDNDWSTHASKYRGEGYRDTFDASLKEINDEMIRTYE